MNLAPINLRDPINRSHPLARGCVARWLTLPGLDGGKYWYDVTGMNHGTLTNMTTSASGWRGTTRPGGFGHLLFDGANDYVACPNINITGSFTLSAWVNVTAFPTGLGLPSIITKDYVSGGSDNVQYNLFLAGPSAFGVLSLAGGTYHAGVNSNAVWPIAGWNTGEWHHAAVTYSLVTCVVYFDGKAVATSAQAAVPTSDSATTNIGAMPSLSRFFNGKIDAASIWSRALPAAEVFADYEESRCGYPTLLRRMTVPMFKRSSGSLLLARRRAAA